MVRPGRVGEVGGVRDEEETDREWKWARLVGRGGEWRVEGGGRKGKGEGGRGRGRGRVEGGREWKWGRMGGRGRGEEREREAGEG